MDEEGRENEKLRQNVHVRVVGRFSEIHKGFFCDQQPLLQTAYMTCIQAKHLGGECKVMTARKLAPSASEKQRAYSHSFLPPAQASGGECELMTSR